MRLAALVLTLAACGAKAPTGPAWPKTADKEQDGGESIAPRGALSAIAKADEKEKEKAKAEDEEDKADDKSADDKSADSAETKSETSKPATETPQAGEEIMITTDEIVIEIDDD